MMVDVVRLREAGVKLSSQAVKDATPMRGELSIGLHSWRAPYAPNEPYAPTRFAKLQAPHSLPDATLLPSLREPRIESLRGDSFVVLGLEETMPEHQQAWWCRLVSEQP